MSINYRYSHLLMHYAADLLKLLVGNPIAVVKGMLLI